MGLGEGLLVGCLIVNGKLKMESGKLFKTSSPLLMERERVRCHPARVNVFGRGIISWVFNSEWKIENGKWKIV